MDITGYKKIEEAIQEAEFVLIGIGEEFRETDENRGQLLRAYQKLAELVSGKPYFVVTQNKDDLIFSSGLMEFFITAPFAEGKQAQDTEIQWNAYLNWLTATLNHKLCILELGVGFQSPQVIRWPFEKTALFNLKSCLVRINGTFPQLPEHLGKRGISVSKNAVALLAGIV